MTLPLLGAATVTRRRTAAGSWGSDGRFVDGATTDTAIRASVQSLRGREVERLPAGARASDWRVVYTDPNVLRVASPADSVAGDRVLVGGVEYRVERVDTYPALLAHDRAYVVRVGGEV